MARTSVGYGANVGQNWGGGGVIYVANLNPANGGLLPPSGYFQFTVGVQGALVDITKVQITVNGTELAFDGTPLTGPAFQGLYAPLSSYSYSVTDNGYTFVMSRNTGFTVSPVSVLIHVETTDGGSADHVYTFLTPAATFVYPPVPFGHPLATIPIKVFTGEVDSGLLAGSAGAAFFSPAISVPSSGSSVDIDNLELRDHAGDAYALQSRPQESSIPPLLWGPAQGPLPTSVWPPQLSPSYKPTLGPFPAAPPGLNTSYALIRLNRKTAIGTLTNTITHVSQTIIV